MSMARLFAVSVMLVGCIDGDDKDPAGWSPGKGDGSFELFEAGPVAFDTATEIALDHRVPAFRVESFGGTKLTIDVKGRGSDAYLIVEGPLTGDGDSVAIGAGTVVGEDDDSGPGRDAHLQLALDK